MPAHLKRKRPYGAPEPAAAATTAAAPTAPAAPRRATRQSSIPPLPVPEDPEPRRRRRRADANANGQPAEAPLPSRSPRGKENMPVHAELQHLRAQQLAKPTTRLTRHSAGQETPYMAAPRPSDTNIHRAKSAAILAPIQTAPMPAFDTQRPTAPARGAPSQAGPGRGSRTATVDPFIPHQQSVSLGRNKPIIMTTSVRSNQNPTSKPNGAPGGGAATGTESTAQPDRNIDKVVLGDICFRAWYPSYYGKEVLGDISGNSTKGGKEAKNNGGLAASHHYHESKDDPNGAKTHGRRDRENHPPMLDRLYVCPCCFKYSKELVAWWEHVRWCERRGYLPGNKIYTHPKGRRTVLVPSGPAPKQGRGKRGSVGQRMVEEVVQDEGEWSIREVDGEEDVLFCQNLSLFAKLFLDNKSVFFDVTGFNYFLLVYTPPPPPPTPTPAPEITGITPPPRSSRSQIVGFFSKEKMSWDNNNLACILVFPPWQRKGLGALLMGVSYAISRREGLLGGPEKPISDLGRRGYKRFWAGEVCRWILSLNSTSDGASAGEGAEKEIVADVDACSQATWIAPEDCLLVLREMGLAEEAGTGPPPVSARARALPDQVSEENANVHGGNGATTEAAPAAAAVVAADQLVRRVRISQAAVRAWVAANRISLERACDPDGFVEGYAIKGRAAGSEEPV
ncbi:males-absent on the first protein [Parachaetomium inaequale]|uniref:Males-absent on the first protein n=1 Tax=Parachaetomium inaequale TaxID=2588326 RepID=A0AAN6PE75_9PEZI|nr:males-absent on the first protein [Parachaetomium inaequale]